jgi:glycerate 2-kinase
MQFPIIKNWGELSTTKLRDDALAILEAGLESVATENVINAQIILKDGDLCIKDARICLGLYTRVFFIGIGKCALDAGAAFEKILGDHITDGIVLDVRGGVLKKLRSYVGTHPYPSEQNLEATKAIVEMVSDITEKDLVITVISGGGSSLLCLPHDLKCETIATITKGLMDKGASIHELNVVRKHTSDIQGGQLAKLLFPATVISFIFSDVPGNDMSTIASGPTVMDTSTRKDAEKILATYDVLSLCTPPHCALVETPKNQKYFKRVTNILLVTSHKALEAMAKKASSLGYRSTIVTDHLEGEARVVGEKLAREESIPRTCRLYGGETTVRVRGKGRGGRNQEVVLGALPHLPLHKLVVAAASDGWDNSDVAGALGDQDLFHDAQKMSLDPISFLDTNNSYEFFSRLGGHIKTGRTGINISDLYFTLTGQ